MTVSLGRVRCGGVALCCGLQMCVSTDMVMTAILEAV